MTTIFDRRHVNGVKLVKWVPNPQPSDKKKTSELFESNRQSPNPAKEYLKYSKHDTYSKQKYMQKKRMNACRY